MTTIKTWAERCDEHPDHVGGMVTESMIQARMQEEIDELRSTLAHQPSKEKILETWCSTKAVSGVPCIYDFARRVRTLR